MKQLTRAECRAALGDMPERTFARWCAKGLPVKGTGEKARFPWPEALQWLFAQHEKRGREAASSGSVENDAKARSALAKAEMDELDLAERRGELMTLASYEEAVGAAFARVRAQLLTLPGKMALSMVGIQKPGDAQTRIQQHVAEVMEELRLGKDLGPGTQQAA